jgi:rubredoxin
MALKRKVYKERENKHQGRKEEWLNLPRRKCDNCGVSYKPTQPTQRFHNKTCRFQFSRNGSAILQLKERIAPEVRKQVQLEVVCPKCNGKGTINKGARVGVVVCETCINGRVLTPLGADILALVTSGHAARIVQNVENLLRQGAK